MHFQLGKKNKRRGFSTREETKETYTVNFSAELLKIPLVLKPEMARLMKKFFSMTKIYFKH